MATISAPSIRVTLGPLALEMRADTGGHDHHHQARRGHDQADGQHGLAEAVAGRLGQLEQLRQDQGHREHREAEHDRGEVGEQHLPAGGGAQVHQRLAWCAAPTSPRPAGRRRRRRTGRGWCRWSSPSRRPWRSASSRDTSPADRPERADQVEAAAGAHLATPARRPRRAARATAPRAAEIQNRTCQSELSAIKAAAGRPRAPPTPSEALISAVDRAEPLGGQLVTHDADAERDDTGGQALQGPADDHRDQGVGQRADDRAGHQQHEADQQHAALAVHVAEPARRPAWRRRRRAGWR